MKVTVIGAGYVGLVTGVCFAEVGYTVSIVEIDDRKLEMLRRGESPIYELGVEELMSRNIKHERLLFTSDIQEAMRDSKIVFIAVGTPEHEDGSADLQYVKAAAASIAEIVNEDCVVAVKSTVPVGSCDEVDKVIQAGIKSRGLSINVEVISNPEFLKEGNAIKDFLQPDRIVVGVNSESAKPLLNQLYAPFYLEDKGKLVFMKRRSSELTKYASNSMLATRISFMNELSRLCDAVNADIDEIRNGMGRDPRIGKSFLFPGPGYGGSCFPKDVKALLKTAEDVGIELEVVGGAKSANYKQMDFAFNKVMDANKGDVRGKSFCVWGLSFKPGTDDVRESPSLHIIRKLVENGAKIKAHDPKAIENFAKNMKEYEQSIQYFENMYEPLEGSDGLILLTEWREYQKPNWEKVEALISKKVIFDFRNQYLHENLNEMGFLCQNIGSNTKL